MAKNKNGNSMEQTEQENKNKAGAAAPGEAGFDKKLDGPNRPSI
ncbi:hypothetical protein SAMN05216378_2151 [Paenibacillus catalpae]|uniref:Uncharacterized protein n=1 Tax=Paenibacillus catalpae TaxID=1045775 RepID=A0A1I1XGL9_9BACL|nr:hypothetical protein [Paenibacillus catalpae]SFE05808.1 hypothetical protein SAMN05216378_2151 [Paenibacillus catalpae]